MLRRVFNLPATGTPEPCRPRNNPERRSMLDTLRANSRSVLTYVLFGIIIVVFVVSFGPGSRGCTSGGRSDSWAAKVNGEAITPTDFDQQYGQLARLYQQQLGGDPSGVFQLRLRQMAMDQV